MRSIHFCPIEVVVRIVPGYRGGNSIKGTGNRNALDIILVERASRCFILAKLLHASADLVLEHFIKRFRHVPECIRNTLIYSKGCEIGKHDMFLKRLRIDFYFADPLSSLQRGTHENSNGLIRKYLQKI